MKLVCSARAEDGRYISNAIWTHFFNVVCVQSVLQLLLLSFISLDCINSGQSSNNSNQIHQFISQQWNFMEFFFSKKDNYWLLLFLLPKLTISFRFLPPWADEHKAPLSKTFLLLFSSATDSYQTSSTKILLPFEVRKFIT